MSYCCCHSLYPLAPDYAPENFTVTVIDDSQHFSWTHPGPDKEYWNTDFNRSNIWQFVIFDTCENVTLQVVNYTRNFTPVARPLKINMLFWRYKYRMWAESNGERSNMTDDICFTPPLLARKLRGSFICA